MKDRSRIIRVCIYFVVTFIMFLLQSKITSIIVGILCLLLYLVVIWLLISWRTFNCIWVCDECDERFKISLWDNIKSFSIFSLKNKLYYRQLYCNKCNKKIWCRCIFQD